MMIIIIKIIIINIICIIIIIIIIIVFANTVVTIHSHLGHLNSATHDMLTGFGVTPSTDGAPLVVLHLFRWLR